MPELKLAPPSAGSTAAASLHVIAVAIVIYALYAASSIVITLVCSIFIAFVLDPGVELMERARVPRWVGSLFMVLLTLAAVYLLVYLIYGRAAALLDDLPKLAMRLRHIVTHFQSVFTRIGQSLPSSLSPSDAGVPTVRVQQESPWQQFLLRGIGSFYAFSVTVMFIPFLVFFMLASKDHVWAASLNLFPAERRQHVEDVIHGITRMAREYVLGNILVAIISAAVITPIFVGLGLPYALILGPVAAFLSLIPYIGVALALLPPLLIALATFETVGPFVVIALTVMVVHFLAVNFLTPKLVGHFVKLNALTITLAMMFWAWLWGGIGLVLAVPLTATLKTICDNVPSLRPLGDWMGGS
jgi:predicted PurR-regulated permease PerM